MLYCTTDIIYSLKMGVKDLSTRFGVGGSNLQVVLHFVFTKVSDSITPMVIGFPETVTLK